MADQQPPAVSDQSFFSLRKFCAVSFLHRQPLVSSRRPGYIAGFLAFTTHEPLRRLINPINQLFSTNLVLPKQVHAFKSTF